jgi:hypothetical protein
MLKLFWYGLLLYQCCSRPAVTLLRWRGIGPAGSTFPQRHDHPATGQMSRTEPQENVWQFMRQTGSRKASSNPTNQSLTSPAKSGTGSSISLGASCPSECVNGHTGSSQRVLVLTLSQSFTRSWWPSNYLSQIAMAASLTKPGFSSRVERAIHKSAFKNLRLSVRGSRLPFRPPAQTLSTAPTDHPEARRTPPLTSKNRR